MAFVDFMAFADFMVRGGAAAFVVFFIACDGINEVQRWKLAKVNLEHTNTQIHKHPTF